VWDEKTKEKLYPDFLKFCNAAGFGATEELPVGDVAEGVSQLAARAGPSTPKAIFAWVPCSADAAGMRARVWAALIRGATAVGYVLHEGGEQVPAEWAEAAALKALNDRLTRLAPAILAPTSEAKVTVSGADPAAWHFKATETGGERVLFVQNPGAEPGKATLQVEDLKVGTGIEVVDEDRALTATAGMFTDDFAPFAEHVYRVKL
jgi:hypothetical protein